MNFLSKTKLSIKLAKNKVKPLKICNLGCVDLVKFFRKKKNINGKVKKTVKK